MPKGDKGGYLQGFALRSTTQVPASALVEIASASGVVQMSATEDFFLALDGGAAPLSAQRPLLFVGYGIQTTMRIAHRSESADIASSNVVGMIEGSDPLLKNEYVVFTAHLDHLGQSKEKIGDNIYNGAMDNASGVATLIETARMFSQSALKPRRSILFIALTGEEKGLVGSGYFAANPSVPVGAIVADINLDMPLLTFDFKNVMAFGSEHSSLKGNAERALKALGLGLIPDPWPAKLFFVRSDHYNFVRQGIPSIFLATGMASFNKDEDAAKLWDEFLEKRYHQPSDDLSQPINYAAAARFATVNYNIGRDIADTPARPTWNKGDFFGDTFRK